MTADWRDLAECAGVDPELFFPDPGASATVTEAKQVCAECEVRTECLRYALDANERFGIFGGKTARERARINSRRLYGGLVIPFRRTS